MRTPAALLALSLLVAGGCTAASLSSPSSGPPEAATPAAPLLTVAFRGGLCPNGPCDRTLAIERDGLVRQTLPEARDLGRVPPNLFQHVQHELSVADFERLGSRPFTGECPVNYDGQEIIFTFHGSSGPIRLASCEVELDPAHPLFVAIEAAIATVPLPQAGRSGG